MKLATRRKRAPLRGPPRGLPLLPRTVRQWSQHRYAQPRVSHTVTLTLKPQVVVGLGRSTPPHEVASAEVVNAEEDEGSGVSSGDPHAIRRVASTPTIDRGAAALGVSSPVDVNDEDSFMSATGGSIRVSCPAEGELEHPEPYCCGYFRDEAECKAKTRALMEVHRP